MQHADSYWRECSLTGLRPSWKFACGKMQPEPLAIIGRSRVGKQMLCRGRDGLHLLMFYGGAWGLVGGPVSFQGQSICASEVKCAMFIEEEDQILLHFELSEANVERRGAPRVAVLHTTAHARSDASAFRWVLDVEQRRAMGRRLAEHTAARAASIDATLGGRLPDFLRLDSHRRELTPTLDFVTVYHAPAPPRPLKMHGRPRFSLDRTSRGFRSSSLKDDQEEACIAALIAVMSTHHRASDQWRVDASTQLLFAHTHAFAVLEQTRATHRSRVGQLRRWLPFAKQLAQVTDDFRTVATSALAVAQSRLGWGERRAPGVCALVWQWIDGGRRADAIFVARRQEWATDDLTAAEWVERCFIHIKREHSMAAAADRRGGDEHDDGDRWTEALEPFLAAYRTMRTSVLTAVHDGIEVVGPTSEQHRDEHLGRVDALLDGVMQNMGTHMRNCKGVVQLARRLHTLLDRMRSVGHDNRRLIGELRVAAGAYTEDVAAIGGGAHAAARELEAIMHSCITQHLEPPAIAPPARRLRLKPVPLGA